MILVDNYFLAILCCVICCACWGSWANTQKMVAAKQWSFELFYWDLTVGLFLTALLGAVTLGSMGSEGRTFFQDLAVMDWSSIQYAFLGGVVWNFGNIFLTAAIAVAGMSVGFPIGGGLAWIGGIVFNYLLISLAGQTYQGNQFLLWSGVLVIIIAILICGKVNGMPREDGYDITVASEIMAILCLSKDITDLKERLSRIIIGYTRDDKPVTAGQLKAQGAMAAEKEINKKFKSEI